MFHDDCFPTVPAPFPSVATRDTLPATPGVVHTTGGAWSNPTAWGGRSETWRFSGTGPGSPEVSALPGGGIDLGHNPGTWFGYSGPDRTIPRATVETHEQGNNSLALYAFAAGPGEYITPSVFDPGPWEPARKQQPTTPGPGSFSMW